LSLIFPHKDYSLARNNIPMLLGMALSLFTILGIYIISVNYMMRQKKIADIKTDFINNMSHEFKTPLATISVATDSLNNDKIATNPEKVKYYSQLIKQENIRMKKQVESVLNMSKLERKEMQLCLKQTNVRELIHKLAESFRLIVEERGGTLTEDFTAEKFTLKIDEFHLSNALINLLDNANKYSPEKPEINIKARNKNAEILLKEGFRKAIHLVAALVPFIADYHFYAAVLFLAVITALYTVFELMRLKGINVFLVSCITSFAARQRDSGKFVLGPVTLALGVILTLLLFSRTAAFIGILALAFGDGLSGLIGKAFGKIHLFHLKDKTVAGSVTCFAAIFISSSFFTVNPLKSLIIAACGTVAELLPLKDFDNILIPLVCAGTAVLLQV